MAIRGADVTSRPKRHPGAARPDAPGRVAALAEGDVRARRHLAGLAVTLIPCDDVVDGTDVDYRPAAGA
jgi:hypothetical protein